MDTYGDLIELNANFDDLLIDSDDYEPVLDEDTAAQALVVPVDYDTDDDSVYEETSGEEEIQVTWTDETTKFDRFVFAEDCGPHAEVESCDNPIDYFQLFLNDELLNLIVMETNRYGSKKMKERKKDWTDTTPEEIRRFIGICLYMGLVRLPKFRDCWSTDWL
ncbi:hypothetical protein GCK32_010462 [Trichostrongylus colubriformis]|uniref:PiggyBac transposable element-derived protein domain-containing protein n=1 Tax=Trichostrongylus colubriformis TaxID=6319 RepID=A0AAN8FCM8_TRICO